MTTLNRPLAIVRPSKETAAERANRLTCEAKDAAMAHYVEVSDLLVEVLSGLDDLAALPGIPVGIKTEAATLNRAIGDSLVRMNMIRGRT